MRLQRRIFIISGLCALLLFAFLRLQPNNDFPANDAGGEVELLIQDGELGSSIARKLENQGIVKSATTRPPRTRRPSPRSWNS